MRPLRRTAPEIFAALLVCSLALAADPAWHDTTRDVYVDGRLDPAVQVLSTDGGKRMAVLLPRARKALLLDREAMTVATVSRKAFALTRAGSAADRRRRSPPDHSRKWTPEAGSDLHLPLLALKSSRCSS